MAAFNRDDLQFILDQIKLSEAHAAGTPLTDLIPNPLLPWGVRTVDGTLNNIITGREAWGAADQPFPRLTDPSAHTGTAPADPFDINGPAPGGVISNTSYTSPASVVDTQPRTISNLIVDQTLDNPAAITAALKFAGITGAAATAARNLIQSQHQAIAPLLQSAQSASAAEASALAALNAALAARDAAILADAAAQGTVAAYDAAIAAAPAAAASAATAQNAVTNFLTLLAIGNPADATDFLLLTAAINAAQPAAADAGAVLAALQSGPNVTAADLTAAQSRATSATLLVTQLTDLESALLLDPNVDPDDFTAAGNAAALATNNAVAAGSAAATLNDADSRDAAVTAAATAAAALIAAEAEVTTRQTAFDAAEAASNIADAALAAARGALDATLAANSVELTDNGAIIIPNIAPDEGISAPFNSWMTLFGQFFDHGLDLVEKTSTSRVYIPLQPDDPLYVDGGNSNFMVITRTTADARNLTTPFVDQNQTYTSHASHQVFLREYRKIADGTDGNTNPDVVATGHLLEGINGGLATWANVKAQAVEMLGIALDDRHVHEVPLLATDLYGMFERAPNGYAMAVVEVTLSDGSTVTARASGKDGGLDLRNIAEADLVGFAAPVGTTVTAIAAVGTGHAFLDDIAHDAAPAFVDPDRDPTTDNSIWTTEDADLLTGNAQPLNGLGVRLTYDDELLDRHFITGDGRGNENIGLTAVHHVFHSEHNRLAEHTKDVVLATADLAFINEWLLAPISEIPADLSTLQWNGERLFQAARFGTEMQYQHLVFEEFARKVNPMVDLFVFNPTMDINPAIFAEFAHVVYRFGHSMLTESVDRLGADGQTSDDIGLIQAFLNPVEFDKDGTVSADVAAGAIVRGMTRQQGNEIDEFVTEALRNNLLGLPLDLATVNIARGRETGMPTLNEARADFYEMTKSQWLKPYTNWVDFAQNLKNPSSVINFVASYGTHQSILDAGTLADKRAAATLLVLGGTGAPADRLDFLNARGAYANDATLGGLNNVDLWIGGLAERILPFGGMLGSTFTFVFEMQMENLQNGDRFYYLSRTQGLHFLTELENNAFSKIIMKNTDLGAEGATHLPGEIFATPQHILEINTALQTDYNPDDPGSIDPVHDDETLEALEPKVARNQHLVVDGNTYENSLKFTGGEHVVLGGSEGNDVLIGDLGDDTVWADGGDDYIVGGHGINRLHGGTGDDIIYGGGDPEFLHGEDGNDVIHAGNGLGDLVFGGTGHDFILAGIDGTEVFGGEGNDFILGTPDVDFLLGGEGDDWIEGGEGFDTIAGENSQLFFNSSVIGHDVMFAGTNEQDFDAESGDDIMVQGESVMRNEGMLGFDWVSFQGVQFGANANMNVKIFTTVFDDILRNRFDRVEAMSGWNHADVLTGDDRVAAGLPLNPAVPPNEQTLDGDELNRDGVERIAGLRDILGLTEAELAAFAPDAAVFARGNILLGGDSSDTILGGGGDDIIDGDNYLNVRIGITALVGGERVEIGTTDRMQGEVRIHAGFEAEFGALAGQQLDTLLFTRQLNAGDLRIVREVLNDTTDNDAASAGYDGDRDVAVFRFSLAEYTIRDADGNVVSSPTNVADPNTLVLNLRGRITVEHTAAIADAAPPRFNDGTDTVVNVERLVFADAAIDLVPGLNIRPTGTPSIEALTNVDGAPVFQSGLPMRVALAADGSLAGVTDANNVSATNPTGAVTAFTVTWQAETEPGSGVFANVLTADGVPVTGVIFTPPADEAAEALEGSRVRAVVSYIDSAGNTEVVRSDATPPVDGATQLTATDGIDFIFGRHAIPNIPANQGFGIDALLPIDGNDTINAGNGDDDAFGLSGNDTFIDTGPGSGNDIYDGGTGTDRIVFAGNVGDYLFEINAEGDLEVVHQVTGEEDAALNIESFEFDDGTFTLAQALAFTELGVAPNLNATEGADILVDFPGFDRAIDGLGGDDQIFGLDGNDTLTGGAGSDILNGGVGTDTAVFVGDPTDTDTWLFDVVPDEDDPSINRLEIVNLVTGEEDLLIDVERIEFRLPNGFTLGFPTAGVIANVLANPAGDPLAGLPVSLTGTAAAETINGTAGNDTLIGLGGNDTLNGGGGGDELIGGLGNDALNGGTGADTAVFSSPAADATFTLQGGIFGLPGNAQVTTAAEGTDTLNGIETIRFADVDYTLVQGTNQLFGTQTLNGGTGANADRQDVVLGFGGSDVLNGNGGSDLLAGGTGSDTVNGGAGNDIAIWSAGDGRDFIDGGADTDTVVVNGDASGETFRIYTRAAAIANGVVTNAQLNANTEIVITRNGTNNASVAVEIDNTEEIILNGRGGANTFLTFGDFTGTSLAFNTIHINGSDGNDTVDITGLLSAHRIVFHSNGGSDTIIGTLRPQDRIVLPDGSPLSSGRSQSNADGTTTYAFTGAAITVAAGVTPTFEDGAGQAHTVSSPHPAASDDFAFTAADLAALKKLVNGIPLEELDDDEPNVSGIRDLEGTGNNIANPGFGSADEPFIRLTEARFGAYDANTGNRAVNPIFEGLDPRAISNVLGAQEAGLPKNGSDANIFLMAFGQYVDHGLDFIPKGGNGEIAIGGVGMSAAGDNPADLTRGTVAGFDSNGVPQHVNKASPFVDQNQAYGSNELVGQFLREGDGAGGLGAHLFAGAPDPSSPAFRLLPTMRELILEHWENNTVFRHESLPGGSAAFRDYYPGLVDVSGAIDAGVAAGLNQNFMGSGFTLVGDANPFVGVLDHFVAGDLRANENVALTSIHTVWARNHNYHVEKLAAAGFDGSAEELFQAAKIVNEAEYQRVVFDDFVDHLIGGLKGSGDHGHDDYNPDVNASISHEFAAAAYRFGHSLIGQTMTILDADGTPKQVPLVDLFLNPTNDANAFTGPLPPGYLPQPGFNELGVDRILGGIVGQQAEEVDFNLVDAVRNDLVRIRADLFAFNVARGWDVGLGTLNQVRAGLLASTDPYVKEAVELSGETITPYTSWEDFQTRNGLSDAVIAQFRQAYPDLVLDTPEKIAAFREANPDLALVGGNTVKGIDRVDLWVGGLAEEHINGGMVGSTFWVILHEQFDRLQEGDRFYYLDRVDDQDFYETLKELKLSDIVARNTGIDGLHSDIFRARPLDAEDDDEDDDAEDDGAVVGDGGSDAEDDSDGEGAGTGGGDTAGSGGSTGSSGGTGGTGTNPQPAAALTLIGTAGDDALLGGTGGDWAVGSAGADTILLGDGENTGVGGEGDDLVAGGSGRDVLSGGKGSDKLFGHAGDDVLYGEDGDDVIDGGAGDDVIDGGNGDDRIDAGSGNDSILAARNDGNDVIDGGAGSDTVDLSAIQDGITVDLGPTALALGFARSGELGSDVLRGIENVVGGQGADAIYAGHAANVLAGGFGADTFVFRSVAEANGDRITDFQEGDRVDVSAIAQHFGLDGGKFTLVDGPITAKGQIVFRVEDRPDGQVTVIEGNVDGNAAADFKIELDGAHNLQQDDFFGVVRAA